MYFDPSLFRVTWKVLTQLVCKAKNNHTRVVRVLYFDCFAFCFLTWTKFLNPKYPDPSKLAILRTQTCYTGSNPSVGGSSDPYAITNSHIDGYGISTLSPHSFFRRSFSEDPGNTKPNGNDFGTEIYPDLFQDAFAAFLSKPLGVFMANSPSALKHSKPGNLFSRTHKMLELAFNEKPPSNLYILPAVSAKNSPWGRKDYCRKRKAINSFSSTLYQLMFARWNISKISPTKVCGLTRLYLLPPKGKLKPARNKTFQTPWSRRDLRLGPFESFIADEVHGLPRCTLFACTHRVCRPDRWDTSYDWWKKSGKLTSWYGKYPIIYKVLYIQTVVVWDFWTINSMLKKTSPSRMCWSKFQE